MADIHLRPVTADNEAACLALRVDESQVRFVASNRRSLDQALLRHYFIRLGFVPGWKAVAPPDAIDETLDALERTLNAVAGERGELTLTIPMACIEAEKPRRSA